MRNNLIKIYMKKLLVYFVNLWDYVSSNGYPFSGFT